MKRKFISVILFFGLGCTLKYAPKPTPDMLNKSFDLQTRKEVYKLYNIKQVGNFFLGPIFLQDNVKYNRVEIKNCIQISPEAYSIFKIKKLKDLTQ